MWKFCQIFANQSLIEFKTSETLNFLIPESLEKCLHITAFKSLPFINSSRWFCFAVLYANQYVYSHITYYYLIKTFIVW